MTKSMQRSIELKLIQQLLPNFQSTILEEYESLKVKLIDVEDRSVAGVILNSVKRSIRLMSRVCDFEGDGGDEAKDVSVNVKTFGVSGSSSNFNFDSDVSSSGLVVGIGADDEKGELKKCLNELEVLKEYIWEQFNIGHWKQVPLVWRSMYSFVSLLKVILMISKVFDDTNCSVCDIIKECDLGLLMGAPILDNILSKIALRLHVQTQDQDNGQGLNDSNITPDQTHSHGQDREIYKSTNANFSSQSENPIICPDAWRTKSISLLPNQSDEVRMNINLILKPSIESFIQEHFSPQRPVVLTDIINHWQAMSMWTLEYLRQVAGSRTVPIEIGSKYTSEDWTQKLVTMEHFIEVYIKGTGSTELNDECGGSPKGYLAQHQLFQQIPELMQDIRIPEYCYVGSSSSIEINAWFGPAGTISPVHYDPKHNLLAQVLGSKVVRLFPPSEWSLLYPHESESMLFNTSKIDVEDPQLFLNFPNCRNARYVDILLEPGMVLYMPPKWAHYVKSLSPSFSVSFWFE